MLRGNSHGGLVGARGCEADDPRRRGQRGPKRVDGLTVGRRAEIRERPIRDRQVVLPSARSTRKAATPAQAIGDEEDRARVRRQTGRFGPEVELGRQVAPFAGREVDEPDRRNGGPSGAPAVVRTETTKRPSGETLGCRNSRRCARSFVEPSFPTSMATRSTGIRRQVRTSRPVGHDSSTVGEMSKSDSRKAGPGSAVRSVGSRRASGSAGNGAAKKRWAPGREPVVPIADRVILEQEGADLGIRARLGSGGVVFQAGGSGVKKSAEGDRVGVSGGGYTLDPTVGREQEARLPALGRQAPESRDLLVRVRLDVRIGPCGGEPAANRRGRRRRKIRRRWSA